MRLFWKAFFEKNPAKKVTTIFSTEFRHCFMSRSTREHTTTICLLGEKHKMDLNRVKQESAVEMKAAERVKHDLEAQIEVLQGKTDRLSKQVAEYDCSVQERMGELNKAEGEVGKLQDMLKTQREKLKDDRVRLEEELAVKEGRYRNIQDELRREIQSTVAMRDERDKISLELKEAMDRFKKARIMLREI